MGLTIHYAFRSTADTPDGPQKHIGDLHRRATDLPLARVGNIVELEGAACEINRRDRDDPGRWLLMQARQYCEDRSHGDEGRSYPVYPCHIIAFSTSPGEGCEEANFGFCRYPESVQVPDPDQPGRSRKLRTQLDGWHWRSSCKTQYASSPSFGGVENFLRCHLSVVAVLDYAQSLGILGTVTDEGGFWENRDVRALAQQVGDWNEMIAGVVGQLKDALGPNFVAQITKFPNFEQLEARGRNET